jgi:hypothetical protein
MPQFVRKTLVIPFLAAVLWGLTDTTLSAQGVKDKNLEAAIRSQLFDPKGELTEAKLGALSIRLQRQGDSRPERPGEVQEPPRAETGEEQDQRPQAPQGAGQPGVTVPRWQRDR